MRSSVWKDLTGTSCQISCRGLSEAAPGADCTLMLKCNTGCVPRLFSFTNMSFACSPLIKEWRPEMQAKQAGRAQQCGIAPGVLRMGPIGASSAEVWLHISLTSQTHINERHTRGFVRAVAAFGMKMRTQFPSLSIRHDWGGFSNGC